MEPMNFGEYCEFMDYDPMDPDSWKMYMIDYDDWDMWEWLWFDYEEEQANKSLCFKNIVKEKT